MTKAEERAKETYPLKDTEHVYDEERVIEARECFVEGYHQAERDMELTVDDIKNIDRLLNQCVDYSNPYQEVLKRFNKERKEK